jgi:two-component system cell cycle sensor histidine kinase/response regulator CckA
MRATGQSSGLSDVAVTAPRSSPERAAPSDGERAAVDLVHPSFGAADPPPALLDRIPTVVLTIDAGGNVIYANGAALSHLGAGADSPVGLPVAVLAPDLIRGAWPAFAATLRATGKLTVETGLRSVDGRLVPVEVTAELIGSGGTEQCALFAVVLRRDPGLVRQQRFVEFSIERLSDAVFCIRHDGRIAYVNQAACKALGYTREELDTMSIFDIDPALGVERWSRLWQLLLQEKRRTTDSAHLTKDGRIVPVEVTCSLFELDGEQFSCAFARDVTERKATEEARQREHAFVESLIDTAPIMVVVLDAEGHIVRFNDCAERITGYELEEVLGESWIATLVPEEDRASVADLLLDAMCGAGMRGVVYRVRTKAGGLRDVLWYDQLLADPESGTVGLLAIGQDVTEQRDLEQRLRQAEKMEAIGRLAGGIAHDFNNQLTAIMGWTDVLSHEAASAPELIECTDRIMVAVRRACDLTSQLLAYSRKGKIKGVTTAVDLHELVHEVVAILRRSLDKRIAIQLDLAAETSRTVGDPSQLGNALLNLALNARDAMPSGGTLRFATRTTVIPSGAPQAAGMPEVEPGRYVELTVADTGTGMNEETQKHVFEPFFTTKEEGRGTGMGLAAVYGTVKNHRGTIAISSAVAAGTTIRIGLPLIASDAAGPVEPAPMPGLPIAPLRVLLVDDDDLVREIVTRLLRQLGCQVVSFASGFDAVEHFRANASAVDVIVLDMVMPLLDGKSTFQALRRIAPDVRVVLVSGYSIDGEAQSLIEAGIAVFLQKPFRLATLADALARAAAGAAMSAAR